MVTVTGPLLDPADAYTAADVVLGMGSSALKGLAYGKPLVVQGEAGFFRLLDEGSLATFLHQGWFGHGGGGSGALAAELCRVLRLPERAQLGRWGRTLVVERFSLGAAAAKLQDSYDEALSAGPRRAERTRSLAASSLRFARFRASLARETVRRKVARS